MKENLRITIVCATLMMLFVCCKQEYIPPVNEENENLLVVEGFLNRGLGTTTISLSRSVELTDTTQKKFELGAKVNVEGENGSSFPLLGNTRGEYSIAQLPLLNNVKYRLHIKTIDGKEYASDFVSIKVTPPIDSITWEREREGVRLYVNTHDPQNATKYYQWEFEETWEFRSAYYSALKYVRDNSNRVTALAFRNPDQSVDTTIYKCWKTLNSTSIIIGSSENLSTDIIYLPFHFIEQGSEKLSVLYSVKLKQYAVSHEKYLFLQKMKKNTEQTGSLFDPQPSQLSGNIHCLTDPNEAVIGYVEITQAQTQRIFISYSQVSDWHYGQDCAQYEIDNNLDSIAKYGADLTPTYATALSPAAPLGILKFNAASDVRCVDCRIGGRTNQKPPFWP
jgi:hypothetical protein